MNLICIQPHYFSCLCRYNGSHVRGVYPVYRTPRAWDPRSLQFILNSATMDYTYGPGATGTFTRAIPHITTAIF